MGYGDWTIGGKVPSVIEGFERNPATAQMNTDSTITFHCVADARVLGVDPRTEIEAFNAMSCQIINNDQLLNGGSKLQVQSGDVITVTEHTPSGDVDYTAALEPVKVTEDYASDLVIKYDLIIHYELTGKSQSAIYLPPYYSYSNATYSCGTDGSNPYSGDEWAGNEMGIFNITETRKVKRVRIKGSACTLPAWISVNEEKQYWQVYHDVAEDPNNQLKYGVQVLTFENFTPSTQIKILTSKHVPPWYPTSSEPGTEMDRGCWPLWIEVEYE